MSGSTNSLLRFGFGQTPTTQFSLRDSYGAAIEDANRERRNALLLQEQERQQQAGAVIRENAPAALSGDQEALRRMLAADPTQAVALQRGWLGLDADRQQAVIRTTGIIGSAAAGLLALPADQRPAAYAAVRADLERQGITGLPAAYPGDAIIEQRARAAVPAAGTLETVDQRPIAGDAPRGFRNNNPLNIEAGPFTRGLPGFQGSDGRFARFETMEQGIAAADALLQRYASTQGLNTVGGIIGRWAPASDGNNVSAYANRVAQALGVRPDQQIDMADPQVRRRLIEAMAQHENGRPLGSANSPTPLTRAGTGLPYTQGAAVGYQWATDPATGQRVQMVIPGGPADPNSVEARARAQAEGRQQTGGRPLTSNDRRRLETAATGIQTVARLADTFNDGFTGVVGTDVTNWMGRNLPGNSYGPQAQWWQDLAAWTNEVRHGTFGATLTPQEKAAFDRQAITPGMTAQQIRANLARQQEIVQAAARRQGGSLIADRYNPEAVRTALGVSEEEFQGFPAQATGQRQAGAPAPAGDTAPRRVASDADYEALPSGALFIGPDGRQRRKP